MLAAPLIGQGFLAAVESYAANGLMSMLDWHASSELEEVQRAAAVLGQAKQPLGLMLAQNTLILHGHVHICLSICDSGGVCAVWYQSTMLPL